MECSQTSPYDRLHRQSVHKYNMIQHRSDTMPRIASRARPVSGTLIPSFCFETIGEMANYAAHIVAGLVRERAALGQRTVIGLPAGSTPLATLREVIRLHREEGLDLSSVVLFLLDEFYGLPADSPQSHRLWLQRQLLDHVNIPADQVYFLDGQLHPSDVDLHSGDLTKLSSTQADSIWYCSASVSMVTLATTNLFR